MLYRHAPAAAGTFLPLLYPLLRATMPASDPPRDRTRPLRILLCGLNYAPELTGIGKYTGELCTWLARQGHEVRVVTTPPYYPTWRVGDGYTAWQYRREILDGVRVYRCPLWVPQRPSGLRRILHLMSFAIASAPLTIWHGLTWRPQVVLSVAPALFSAPGALLAAKLGGARSWLHIQDFEIEAAFSLGLLAAGGIRAIALQLEGWLFRHFDRVSTIARPMQQRLLDKRVPATKLVLFPNWVDTEAIYPLPRTETPNAVRAALGLGNDRVLVLYSGNMGKKQGLEVAIAAARQLASHPNISFLFCGDGVERPALMQQARDLPNVTFWPLQPAERLNELLNAADIHLLPQRADVADLVMPSKLGGILACGGAAIASAHPHTEVAAVVTAAGGIVVPPGDADHLAEAIAALATRDRDRQRMQQQARAYAEDHLSSHAIFPAFQTALQALCASPAKTACGKHQG